MTSVIASMIRRDDPVHPGPVYYARPSGAALAAHGLPTGIQRSPKGFRAVIARRYRRDGFSDVASALAWRELALSVLAIPMHYRSDCPETEAVRLAFLRGGLGAVGL